MSQSRIADEGEEGTVEPKIITNSELVYIAVGNLMSSLVKYHKTEILPAYLHLM